MNRELRQNVPRYPILTFRHDTGTTLTVFRTGNTVTVSGRGPSGVMSLNVKNNEYVITAVEDLPITGDWLTPRNRGGTFKICKTSEGPTNILAIPNERNKYKSPYGFQRGRK